MRLMGRGGPRLCQVKEGAETSSARSWGGREGKGTKVVTGGTRISRLPPRRMFPGHWSWLIHFLSPPPHCISHTPDDDIYHCIAHHCVSRVQCKDQRQRSKDIRNIISLRSVEFGRGSTGQGNERGGHGSCSSARVARVQCRRELQPRRGVQPRTRPR